MSNLLHMPSLGTVALSSVKISFFCVNNIVNIRVLLVLCVYGYINIYKKLQIK
jgi:hypothetical protein